MANEITQDTFETITNGDNKLVVVGYSPTGNGHAARTLSIVTQALKDGHIKEGDVVLLHLPNIHEAMPKFNPGAKVVDDAAKTLTAAGVKVILAVADKAVIGYLDRQGASDNPRILSKFAEYPSRASAKSHILQCGQLWSDDITTAHLVYCDNDNSKGEETHKEKMDRESLPVSDHAISAKNLFISLNEIIGNDRMKEKVYVISDMDPYIQKAACAVGVPHKQRLDQQNHAILIQDAKSLAEIARGNAEPTATTLQESEDRHAGDKAILAKVLDGSEAKVSHIGLGDQNTLQDKANEAIKLLETNETKITAQTTRVEVKHRVIDYLGNNAEKIALDQPYTTSKGGVMWPPGVANEDIQNIVYIYVHGASMPKIGEYIREQINNNHPDYQDKVFLFCGPGAMKKDANNQVGNALVLAYLAEADGVTNAGAGTTGEFVYLHRHAGDNSALALFPQINQHEQEANAKYIQELYGKESINEGPQEEIAGTGYVEVGSLRENEFTTTLDSIVKHKQLPDDGRTMAAFFDSVLTLEDNVISYPKQASDFLFEGLDVLPTKSQTLLAELQKAEINMRQDPSLTANRRYLKFVFAVLNELEKHINSEIRNDLGDNPVDGNLADENPIHIKLKQNDQGIDLRSAGDVLGYLEDNSLGPNLTDNEASSDDTPKLKEKFTSYSSVCGFFKQINAHTVTNTDAAKQIKALKDEIGQSIKVGF